MQKLCQCESNTMGKLLRRDTMEHEINILNEFIKKDEEIMTMQEMKALVKVILNINEKLSNQEWDR